MNIEEEEFIRMQEFLRGEAYGECSDYVAHMVLTLYPTLSDDQIADVYRRSRIATRVFPEMHAVIAYQTTQWMRAAGEDV